ncbi:EpsG family protein [Streptococcus macedonicus]|uniref:EpsG family protein n=1 Tax=Streptococcus macedonicus TaxID=59310 RepID=UPI0004D6E96F|nr:EpsG family protein [Streptococcus macedonicus]KEH52329.1 hypothetical protein FD61_04425 [Streptococcus macedonicus]
MIYIYTILFSSFFAWLYDLLRNKDGFIERIIKRSALIISFLPLYVIGAIRFNVGTDYLRYTWYQIPFAIAGKEVKFEFFPTQIARFGYWLGGGATYQYIFALFHFIIIFFLFLAFVKQSQSMALSVLLLMFTTFYPFSLNVMRQAMATAIFLWGLQFLQEKKYIKYVICILVCSLFHTIATLYLGLILFDFIKLNRKKVLLLVGFLSLFTLFGRGLLLQIISRFGIYTEYLNWQVSYSQLYIVYALVLTVVTFLLLNFVDSEDKEKFRAQIYTNYAFVLSTFFIPVLPEGTRLYFLFMPIHILLLPNLQKYSKRKDIVLIVYLLLSVFYVFFFYRLILVNNANEVLPYRTIFDK